MACLLLLYVFPFVGLISTVQAEFNTKRNNDSAPVVSETCATYHNDVEAFYIFLPFRPFRGFERNLEPLSQIGFERFWCPREQKRNLTPLTPSDPSGTPSTPSAEHHRLSEASILNQSWRLGAHKIRIPDWYPTDTRVSLYIPILMKHGWPKKNLIPSHFDGKIIYGMFRCHVWLKILKKNMNVIQFVIRCFWAWESTFLQFGIQ